MFFIKLYLVCNFIDTPQPQISFKSTTSCGSLCVLQEEKIEPVTSNTTFNSDSSWKIPAGNSILMRASQLSSEFERGDQSYLRLSLGQFFEQRSEALGCLGSADNIDAVKRVSKNYHWNRNKKCCLSTDIGILKLIQIEGRKKSDTDILSDI